MGDTELTELPALGQLLGRAMLPGRRPAASKGLPAGGVRLAGLVQDRQRLAAYDRVCGFTVRDAVPATWLHVLTFPLQTWLMAQPDFPFKLAGLIHVGNEMVLRRPVDAGESLDLRVRADNARPHRKGTTFDLAGEVWSGGEQVWQGTSTYLSTAARMPGEPASTPRLDLPDGEISQVWRLDADLGRRYAAVSGDSNPIHLSPLTARLFGQPRAIVHGMWTHARALAALEGSLPAAYSVQVQFARPVLLPGRVGFIAQPADADPRGFAVVSPRDGKPHLVGRIGEVDAASSAPTTI